MSTTLDDHMTTARTPQGSRSARNTTAAKDTDSEKKTPAARSRAKPAKTAAGKSAAISAAVHDAVTPDSTANATNETLQGGAPPAATNDLRRLIAEAAYYRAERRGFAPGGEELDWLEAEAEVRGKRRN